MAVASSPSSSSAPPAEGGRLHALQDLRVDAAWAHGAALVELHRPARGNALTSAMISSLSAALDALEADPAVHVVVVTGAGRYFCTGMDLAQMSSPPAAPAPAPAPDPAPGTPLRAAHLPVSPFERLRNCTKPTVAMVNGPVLGGGTGIFFACDVRAAVRGAYMQFPEARLGLVPAFVCSYAAPELGPARARRYFMTATRVPPEELREAGVLAEVCADAQALDEATRRIVRALLEAGPGALRASRELVGRVCDPHHDENTADAARVFGAAVAGPEAAFGIRAFLARQKPDWDAFVRREGGGGASTPAAKL